MAKLNWKKLQQASKAQAYKDRYECTSYFNFDENKLWSLAGKYYGVHYGKLPLDYLCWVIDNSKSGKHKGIAEGELYRRYNELTNT